MEIEPELEGGGNVTALAVNNGDCTWLSSPHALANTQSRMQVELHVYGAYYYCIQGSYTRGGRGSFDVSIFFATHERDPSGG